MRKYVVLFLVIALPLAGLVLGAAGAPLFARAHTLVRLADDVRLHEAGYDVADLDEIEAFVNSKEKAVDVIANAEDIVSTFRIGAAAFGAWCGLVFALKIFAFNRTRRREIHEIDYDACVACARCFMSCPRERLRRGETAEAQHETPPTGAQP